MMQNCFGHNIFNSRPIFNFCSTFSANKAPNIVKKIFVLKLNEMEDICEMPLSETINYTSVPRHCLPF